MGVYSAMDFSKLNFTDIYSMPNCNCNYQTSALEALAPAGGIALGFLLGGLGRSSQKGNGGAEKTVDPNASLKEKIAEQTQIVTDAKISEQEAQTNYDKAVEAWNAKNEEIAKQIETETNNVETYNNAVKDNETQTKNLNLKNDAVSKLTTKNEELNGEISTLSGEITGLDREIQTLQGRLGTASEEAKASIQAQINEKTTLKQQKETEKQQKEAEVKRNQGQIDQLNKEIGEINTKIKQNDTIINNNTYSGAQQRLSDLEAQRTASMETDTEYQPIIEALNSAKENVKTQEETLENLKKQLNMSSNIDAVDGSGFKRLLDGQGVNGEGSIRDQLAAFRKASDKFTNDPTSLNASDLKALKNAEALADAIDKGNDQSDRMKQVSSQLRAWASTHKSDIEAFERVQGGSATAQDIKSLSGYFKSQTRDVDGTKQTIYNGKGSNDSYYIDDKGVAHHLTYIKEGNALYKARYTMKTQGSEN